MEARGQRLDAFHDPKCAAALANSCLSEQGEPEGKCTGEFAYRLHDYPVLEFPRDPGTGALIVPVAGDEILVRYRWQHPKPGVAVVQREEPLGAYATPWERLREGEAFKLVK
jgi:hypothetical protein